MADILSLVFRHFSAQPVRDFKLSSHSECNTLVVGDGSIKSSLLFLAAVTAASDLGQKVIFFTKTPIQSLPVPLQQPMSSRNPDSLKKIRFVYPRLLEELLQGVAALHELTAGATAPPSLLIVEGLEHYLRGPGAGSGQQREEQCAAAHAAALLHDTAAFLTRSLEKRGGDRAPCRVIVSFQSNWEGRVGGEPSAPDPILSVLDRYFQVRCTFDQERRPAAAAEGAQSEWQVFLSGPGITAEAALGRQWHLVVQPNGAMEFSLVSGQTPSQETAGF